MCNFTFLKITKFLFFYVIHELMQLTGKKIFPVLAAEDIYSLVFSQDTVPLLTGSDLLKVHQKSDNLMFRFSVKVSREVHCKFHNG